MTTINVNYENTRPKVCAFFAGRAWYAGIESGQKNGWVMFSQVATDIGNFAKCYQEGDPTSEVFSDIKDDDGGVIPIPDAGEIVELKALGPSLIVFASNGVWQIIGGDNGFTATSYSVQKITNAGCVGSKTVVEVEDSIMYWGNNGVYLLQVDQTGISKAENITQLTINSFYADIPVASRFYAQGAYSRTQKIAWWGYNKDSTGNYTKNRILCFDVRLGAWYAYDVNDDNVLPVAIAVTSEGSNTTQTFNVDVNDDDVYVDVDRIVTDVSIVDATAQQFKLLTLVPNGTQYDATWSDLNSNIYQDWGVDASAYFITGYSMGSTGPSKAKTAGYVHAFLKRCPVVLDANAVPQKEASVKMQTRWDFTDNVVAGKWGDEYEVYRVLRPFLAEPSTTVENGYPLVITKNKVRGRGKALQIKWSSNPLKEMKMVGWSVNMVENTNV